MSESRTRTMKSGETSKRIIPVIYLLGFLFALHSALPVYINSSFLAEFTTDRLVGLIYTISSVLTIASFAKAPAVLRRLGNYRMTMFLLAGEFISLVGLIYLRLPALIIFTFIINFVLIAVIGFNIDIFLEKFSANKRTGGIRGIFLSSVNGAWVVVPILSSLFLTDSDYRKVYLAAALLGLPAIFLIRHNLKNFKDPVYEGSNGLIGKIRQVTADKNVRNIFVANFIMQFFFAWMVIYTPIYLHNYIGFSWKTIGVIFSIMLLPFVILEAPLGRIADRYLGEKELLAAGFVVMILSTTVLTFIGAKSAILWATLLFLTRVGASTVEIMSETYFFKKVNVSGVEVISTFRMSRPLAHIIGPAIATAILVLIPVQYLFLVLSFILLFGLGAALIITDTR